MQHYYNIVFFTFVFIHLMLMCFFINEIDTLDISYSQSHNQLIDLVNRVSHANFELNEIRVKQFDNSVSFWVNFCDPIIYTLIAAFSLTAVSIVGFIRPVQSIRYAFYIKFLILTTKAKFITMDLRTLFYFLENNSR
jgi:hypothetical protein